MRREAVIDLQCLAMNVCGSASLSQNGSMLVQRGLSSRLLDGIISFIV